MQVRKESDSSRFSGSRIVPKFTPMVTTSALTPKAAPSASSSPSGSARRPPQSSVLKFIYKQMARNGQTTKLLIGLLEMEIFQGKRTVCSCELSSYFLLPLNFNRIRDCLKEQLVLTYVHVLMLNNDRVRMVALYTIEYQFCFSDRKGNNAFNESMAASNFPF